MRIRYFGFPFAFAYAAAHIFNVFVITRLRDSLEAGLLVLMIILFFGIMFIAGELLSGRIIDAFLSDREPDEKARAYFLIQKADMAVWTVSMLIYILVNY